MKREAGYYSDTGGRHENEDSCDFRIGENSIVAVLADGLGGQGDGKAASALACETLIQCGGNEAFPSAEAIRDAFAKANQNIISHQKNTFHMKTTAVYLCVQGSRAVWAHIGDSRLYHVYRHRIADYTLDHSASQLSVFMGSITREQIPQDAGRSRLIRALGVEGGKPDLHDAVQLEPGRHAFLLCSDGLWEYLTDSDIISCCENARSAETCCATFREIKNSRCPPDCDNNTAIVIFWEV